MATVSVEVNGQTYVIGCEDGQENHLIRLARDFDKQVREVAQQVGQVGELRLMLMSSLMVADELAEVKQRLVRLQAEAQRAQNELSRAEGRAAAALEAAARRIEDLAHKAGPLPA